MTSSNVSECVFCTPSPMTFQFLLLETEAFRVICDTHPLTEGHLLIIPKKHVSCIGDYDEEQFREFTQLYDTFSLFINKEYGSISTFEHGVFGQTVFHSHVHLVPFEGKPDDIVVEGKFRYKEFTDLGVLSSELEHNQGYLYFSIANKRWLVDTSISFPRFFRDRYAMALRKQERMDWKTARKDAGLMNAFMSENRRAISRWNHFSK